MNKNIFDKFTKESLSEYLIECSKLISDFDIDKAYNLAINAIKYYNGDKSKREELRLFQDLENKWYDSLNNKSPDYSIYNEKYFLSDIWACWVVYSRKYLLTINNEKSLFQKSIVSDIGNINSVIDLGCGFGYTTAGLKQLFPSSEVYGTNFKDSYQYQIASKIGLDYDFSLVENIQVLNKQIDLVFASEYFEHIENPIEHLIDIINICNPKYFLIANAFNSKSVGHFDIYKHGGLEINSDKISKLFNLKLKELGYEKVETKLWNNRPNY